MWNNQNPTGAPVPPNAGHRSPEATSPADGAFIGETMLIKGEIYSVGELRVEGEVNGKMESESRLTIGAKGKAEAAIKASEVIVGGTVKGNVEATQRIVLRKGANLVGDVKTAGIVIEDGAYFRGGIDIARPDGPPPATR